jgi:hypothetical protein
MLGGTIVQTIVLLWATIRTNWGKEVDYVHRHPYIYIYFTIHFVNNSKGWTHWSNIFNIFKFKF